MSELKEVIRSISAQRKLSLSQMSTLLGYSSTTSLTRIISGNVRKSTVIDFYDRIQNTFPLNSEESLALRRAVDIRVNGSDAVQEKEAFRAWLTEERTVAPTLLVTDPDGGNPEPFAQRYGAFNGITLEIINCAYPALYGALEEVLGRTDAEVFHYFRETKSSADLARILKLVQDLLNYPNYHCFIRSGTAEAAGLLGADLIFCSWKSPTGPRSELLSLQSAEEAIAVPIGDGRAIAALIRSLEPEMTSLKRNWPVLRSMQDYIDYSGELCSLETNSETWEIKPDLCICCISPRILKAALVEGPLPQEQLALFLDSFAQQHARRYDNMLNKRKATHMLFKMDAMLQFSLTGRVSDHFVGFRPFTPLERVSILNSLLHQQLENKYFYIHFLRDDQHLPDNNLMIYGKKHMSLFCQKTHYDMNQEYTDVLLELPEAFVQKLKRFYIYDLVKERCLPEADSIAFLMSLLTKANESTANP